MIAQLINWSFLILVLFLILRFVKKLFVQYTMMNKYKTCIDLFDYFMDQSYQIIYKDQLLPFSTNGMVPGGDDLETSKRNFVKLNFQLMGPEVVNILIQFYGGRQVLITNMLTYFQSKLDDDEIMKILNNVQTSQTQEK